MTGTITSMISGGFQIQGGQGLGFNHILVTSSTVVTGPAPFVGENVEVVGTGTLSSGNITATSVKQLVASPSPSPSAAPAAATPTPGSVISPPSSIISITGPINQVISGRLSLYAGPSHGYMYIYVDASTAYLSGQPAVGEVATVTGTGKIGYSINATSVSMFASTPSSVTATGTVTQAMPYGLTMNVDASHTVVPVTLTSATVVGGAPLTAGSTVTVTGTGSTSASINAIQIVVATPTPGPTAAPPTPTPGPIAMKHVMTSDYLGGLYGTTSIAWSAAAPYLTWAQTNSTDSPNIRAAGIKTQDYIDPNRLTGPSDPMWGYATESDFAHDCSANRITYTTSITQYVTDPNSASLQSHYNQYTSVEASRGGFDAVFEDNAGPLGPMAAYATFSAMPCNYSDANWVTGGIALNQASTIPIIVNGLNILNGHSPSLAIGLLAGSNTVGGNFEHCFSDDQNAKMTGWEWQATETSQLEVTQENKLFECQLRNQSSASTMTDARLFAYASFLLTYDPNRSIFWDEYPTTSGLHVEPESQLVALDPLVPTPSDVSGLLTSSGNYGREYAHCFYAGNFVGPCAVVVNADSQSAHTFPYPQYQHSLVLNGGGVLDGGTAATNGPPPPLSLPPSEAMIVFP